MTRTSIRLTIQLSMTSRVFAAVTAGRAPSHIKQFEDDRLDDRAFEDRRAIAEQSEAPDRTDDGDAGAREMRVSRSRTTAKRAARKAGLRHHGVQSSVTCLLASGDAWRAGEGNPGALAGPADLTMTQRATCP